MREVVLLTPEQELGESIELDSLVKFIKELEAVAGKHLLPLRGGQAVQVMLQCDLSLKEKYKLAVKSPPNGTEKVVKDMVAALAKVEVPDTKGPAEFQLIFEVKPR